MDRLEAQADDLIANGDPNGAALSIGKAAMMAGILAKQESDDKMKEMFAGAESLFRTQENSYRAIALFKQAGGQPPAPNGACQLLTMAGQHSKKARSTVAKIINSEPTPLHQRFSEQVTEWDQIIKQLRVDFSC